MTQINSRLDRLESALPRETQTHYIWRDPGTGEYRYDRPPADVWDSHEWLHIEANSGVGEAYICLRSKP